MLLLHTEREKHLYIQINDSDMQRNPVTITYEFLLISLQYLIFPCYNVCANGTTLHHVKFLISETYFKMALKPNIAIKFS